MALIKREDALKALCEYCPCEDYEFCESKCAEYHSISTIPEFTARREVVEYNDGSVDVECGNCGWDVPRSGTRYCAHCGARLED